MNQQDPEGGVRSFSTSVDEICVPDLLAIASVGVVIVQLCAGTEARCVKSNNCHFLMRT